MTAPRRDKKTCPHCKAHARCAECGKPIDVEEPFAEWIRGHPALDSVELGLSIQNIDYVVHRCKNHDVSTGRLLYRQLLMLLEVKSHGAKSSFAQKDTFAAIDQAIHRGDQEFVKAGHSRFILSGGKTKMFYYGFHTLRMSGADPCTSDWMTWDDRPIDVELLVRVLCFDVDPNTLIPRPNRLHHRKHPVFDEDWVK